MLASTRHPDLSLRILPIRPNWSSSYRVTYEFKTGIFTSGDGKEQRRAQRQNPRKEIEFSAVLHGDRKLSFNRLMDTWQGHLMVMGEHVHKVVTTAPMVVDDEQVGISGNTAWLRENMLVLLVSPDGPHGDP